jgi:hypothetical protein
LVLKVKEVKQKKYKLKNVILKDTDANRKGEITRSHFSNRPKMTQNIS